MDTPRYVLVALVSAAAIVMGCGQHSSSEATLQASSTATSAPAPPAIGPQFDTAWLGVSPNQPAGWKELGRTVNTVFQQFDFRPEDETESPRGCNGCAPFTAILTAYAPGKFNPAETRTSQPVSVIGDNDGFYRPATDTEVAMLYWQYAENAWATVRGKTTMTGQFDKMRELAGALRPGERTPARLPLSLATLPADMPLAQIDSDGLGYGTRVKFSPCGPPSFGYADDSKCMIADILNVQIWPRDDYFGIVSEDRSVPVRIGGKDGLYDETSNEAAVKVAPDMLVKFHLERPGPEKVTSDMRDILAGVAWAPDPANEATWPEVAQWVR